MNETVWYGHYDKSIRCCSTFEIYILTWPTTSFLLWFRVWFIFYFRMFFCMYQWFLRSGSGVPFLWLFSWPEAMRNASYVMNKHPQQRLGFLSLFEKLWNMKANVSYFRVFGCVCYVFIPNQLCSKLGKIFKYIFIRYDNQIKGCKWGDPTTGRFYTSRHVVFDETSS